MSSSDFLHLIAMQMVKEIAMFLYAKYHIRLSGNIARAALMARKKLIANAIERLETACVAE